MYSDGGCKSYIFRFFFFLVHIFSKFLEQPLQKLKLVVHNLGDGWICLYVSKHDVFFESRCLTVRLTKLHVTNYLIVFIIHSYDLVSWEVYLLVVLVISSACYIA